MVGPSIDELDNQQHDDDYEDDAVVETFDNRRSSSNWYIGVVVDYRFTFTKVLTQINQRKKIKRILQIAEETFIIHLNQKSIWCFDLTPLGSTQLHMRFRISIPNI